MFNMNKVILVGIAASDSKASKVNKNTVNKISLALNKSWKDKNQNWKKQVTFVNVDFWGDMDQIAKGTPVFVEGSLQSSSWEDENGNKRSSVSVKANIIKAINLQKNNKSEQEEEEEVVGSTPF